MNKPIVTALTTIGIAQLIKIPIKRRNTGEWDWKAIFETGGMPSSHSAGVSSLATYIALKQGVKTIDFALSAIFGLLVMYDAQGVRRQAGELTIKINKLEEEVERYAGQKDDHYHDQKARKLKERLGHHPIEVAAGSLFGILTGGLSCLLFENRK